MMTRSKFWSMAVGGLLALAALPAAAQDPVLGAPHDKGIGLQAPATDLAKDLDFVHNDILMPIITVITLFVMALLLIVIFRFNEKRNPVPSKTAHNTLLEVVWTVVPALILVFIAVFSFPLLYKQLDVQAQNPELTIRAIGHQWYWSYEYPDNGNFTFEARYVPKDQIQAGQVYLLDTDNEVVLPVNTNIRIQVTAADVIHSWTVPSFGVKHDGVPGKVNESWFNINEPGIYYGQCSELCGVQHAYMPIKVHAVSKEEFQAWVAEAQQKFDKVEGTASLQDGTQDVAAAQ
ncbi:MAG TPA: cytochrome c oxidase subunit II [Alphaproteobacteria bacterium]|nr:cytochrome c oxidase subunit II [Alphaproteobacteria bacterium]